MSSQEAMPHTFGMIVSTLESESQVDNEPAFF